MHKSARVWSLLRTRGSVEAEAGAGRSINQRVTVAGEVRRRMRVLKAANDANLEPCLFAVTRRRGR